MPQVRESSIFRLQEQQSLKKDVHPVIVQSENRRPFGKKKRDWEMVKQSGVIFWRDRNSGECRESNPTHSDPGTTLNPGESPQVFGTGSAMYESGGYDELMETLDAEILQTT